jgi:hypothetical protein
MQIVCRLPPHPPKVQRVGNSVQFSRDWKNGAVWLCRRNCRGQAKNACRKPDTRRKGNSASGAKVQHFQLHEAGMGLANLTSQQTQTVRLSDD